MLMIVLRFMLMIMFMLMLMLMLMYHSYFDSRNPEKHKNYRNF